MQENKEYEYEYEYKAPNKLFKADQRNQWWTKYGQYTQSNYQSLPEPLKRDDLEEITTQPLLNYLLALSYDRGKLDFSIDITINQIYEDLLSAVHDRGSEGDRQHTTLQGIEYDNFKRILEEIAIATWHGNGPTTTVRQIEERCQATGLIKQLKQFQESAETGVIRLLTAFYFRQSGTDHEGEGTFEFTHKSFSEYLIACRIVRFLPQVHKQLEPNDNNPDDGWNEGEALQRWVMICGPTEADRNMVKLLRNAISQCKKEDCVKWQITLTQLINSSLKSGTPMEDIKPQLGFKLMCEQARNAEEVLLATLSACAYQTKSLSQTDWPLRTSFGSWMYSLHGQRSGFDTMIAIHTQLPDINLVDAYRGIVSFLFAHIALIALLLLVPALALWLSRVLY